MRRLFIRIGQVLLGLLIFSLGVHLTIRADLGLAPWDCLGMGLAGRTPLTYGAVMTVMGVVILGIDLLLGEKIGLGTVIDALLTGNFVQLFQWADPFPETPNVPAGLAMIAAGLLLMALGQVFYMRAAMSCGPRDALLVGLGKRVKRVPIGAVQVLLWGVVLGLGYALGGKVGIGTLVTTFGGGPAAQLVFRLTRFEPRDVAHESIAATFKAAKADCRPG